jgi:hypothetical protein
MTFWDSSALVPLLAREASTPTVQTVYAQDMEVVVWWATPVECARLDRVAARRP